MVFVCLVYISTYKHIKKFGLTKGNMVGRISSDPASVLAGICDQLKVEQPLSSPMSREFGIMDDSRSLWAIPLEPRQADRLQMVRWLF